MKVVRAPAKCMPIRDEELVQFLLGEADAAMRLRVEASLAAEPQVAQRLQELRAALGLLDSLKSSVEPPEDLVSRTLRRIADAAEPDALEPDPLASEQLDSHEMDSCEVAGEPVEVRRPSNWGSASSPALAAVPARKLRSSGSVWDSAILSVSIAALACLFLPLVLQARFDSRRVQCAYNLKILGEGLTHLANLDSEHRFPSVPARGADAFAGVYSLRLKDAGLLPTTAYLRCVSIPASDGGQPHIICVPSSQDFLMADASQQSLWRAGAGGNYAYSLGVVEEDRVVGPRLQGRSHFAILADAPTYIDDREVFQAHEGRGINIFYEDGHVAFEHLARALPSAVAAESIPPGESVSDEEHLFGAGSWAPAIDHPFRNLQGERAAGLTPDDAALGPSYSTPRPMPMPMRARPILTR